jgi:hypothetical protein
MNALRNISLSLRWGIRQALGHAQKGERCASFDAERQSEPQGAYRDALNRAHVGGEIAVHRRGATHEDPAFRAELMVTKPLGVPAK